MNLVTTDIDMPELQTSTQRRAVILDDDEFFADMLKTVTESVGYDTQIFIDSYSFVNHRYSEDDLIIMDLSLPGMDGIEVLRVLKEKAVLASIVLVSGQDRSVLKAAEDLARAQSLNHIATLSKPLKVSQLREILQAEFRLCLKAPSQVSKDTWVPSREELKRAIRNEEICSFYQPQVELATGRLAGVEALARWRHPKRGIVPPFAFIRPAEEYGLISELTDQLLRKSIIDISKLRSAGLSDFNVSVNVSATTITSYSLPEVLLNLATENQIRPEFFTLEITETGLMTELVKSLDILTRIRMKGFNLSIDDFGTGYSSLSLLHKMPFNELKIDRSFVAEMMSDPDSRSIVETCIMLARKLGMRTVAEGIEDLPTLMELRALGCEYAQGYYVAKPMPIEALPDWFHLWKRQSDQDFK